MDGKRSCEGCSCEQRAGEELLLFLCGGYPSLQGFSDTVFEFVDVFALKVGGTRSFGEDDEDINIADDDLLVAVEKSRLFCALCGIDEEDVVFAHRCGQVSDAIYPARFFVERGQGACDSLCEGLRKGGGLRHDLLEARRIGRGGFFHLL